MPDLLASGLGITDNDATFAVLVSMTPWIPSTPQEILPGGYDAETTALQRLYYQFSRSPEWRDLAAYIGSRYTPIVTQMPALREQRELANATGPALDDLGAAVGLPRMGLGDEGYRTAIRVRGASLLSDGTIPDIMAIVAGLFGLEAAAGAYVPWYPRRFALYVPTLTAAQLDLLVFLLGAPLLAGVGLTLVVTDPAAPGPSYTDPGTDDVWTASPDYTEATRDLAASAGWGYSVAVG